MARFAAGFGCMCSIVQRRNILRRPWSSIGHETRHPGPNETSLEKKKGWAVSQSAGANIFATKAGNVASIAESD
jgi:hypothetical protein